MVYRLYSGPVGSEDVSPIEQSGLYKEFTRLDEALSFARHLKTRNRVPLILEGDDGTRMNRREIAAALLHGDADSPNGRTH
jgi:hypothetical protein